MKRLISLVIACLLLLGASVINPAAAKAHDLKEDNGIAAVLHIAPDDNPRSGQPTLLYFDFDSQNPEFDLSYCKCQVSFQSSENKLSVTAITPAADKPLGGYATVVFEKPGVYNLTVRGQTGTDTSEYFNLRFAVRVVAGTTAAEASARRTAGWQVVLLSITSLGILGIIAAEMIRKGGRYRRPATKK